MKGQTKLQSRIKQLEQAIAMACNRLESALRDGQVCRENVEIARSHLFSSLVTPTSHEARRYFNEHVSKEDVAGQSIGALARFSRG